MSFAHPELFLLTLLVGLGMWWWRLRAADGLKFGPLIEFVDGIAN